jgi:type IV pilus assembly protein PilE
MMPLPPRTAGRRGFTLIELLIAMAISAILVAIALPSYRAHVEKSRRTDARNALLDLASRQEKFFSTNNAYTANPADLGYGGSAFPVAVRQSGATHYNLRLTLAANRLGWTATAEPQGAQTRDSCGSFTLTNLGVQGNTGNSVPTARCW